MENKISKNCWTIDGQSTDNRRTFDGQSTDNRRTFDGQSTDIRRTTDGHVTDNGRTCDGHVTDMCATSTGKMRYFARIAALLLMLITMSVGEVWADWWDVQKITIYYSVNGGANQEYKFYNGDNNASQQIALGTITSSFKIASAYIGIKDDWGNNKKCTGADFWFTKDNWNNKTGYGNGYWSWWDNKSDQYYEVYNNNTNWTLANNTDPSGKYELKFYWQMYCSGGNWTYNNGGNNYKFTYTILPPAVTNFSVSGTGSDIKSGSGTEADPYIIVYGGSLTLNASCEKAHTDANSSRNYKFGSGEYSTTATSTISNVTSSAKQSVEVRARCINNSASLNGAESSTTIYYQAERYPVNFGTMTSCAGMGNVTATTASGSLTTGEEVTYDTRVTFTATPQTGYEFVEWHAGADGSGDAAFAGYPVVAYGVTTTANMFAKFQAKSYAVNFSGSNFTPSFASGTEKAFGSTVTFTLEAAQDYAIDGVTAKDASDNTIVVTTNAGTYSFTMPASAVTVTVATHSTAVPTFLIRYLNGEEVLQSGQVNQDVVPSYVSATPTKAATAEFSYSFTGWSPTPYAADKAQDYVAQFSETRVPYTLTWDFAGGATATHEEDYTHGSVANASTITKPADPTRTGYTFAGWDTEIAKTMPTANTTYTATWTPITYTISFDANGGEAVASRNYTIETETFSLPTTTRAGYTFLGWHDSGRQLYTEIEQGTTGDLSLVAWWYGRFALQGSENKDGDELKGMPGWNDYNARFEADPLHPDHFYCERTLEANTKYKFQIWDSERGEHGTRMGCDNKAEMAYNTATPWKLKGSADVTFTTNHAGVYVFELTISNDNYPMLKWYDKKYSVTVNDGDHGTVEPHDAVEAGAMGVQLNVIPATGYSLASWDVTGGATVSNGSGKLYATADGTATATYTAINYTITYNLNGGTGAENGNYTIESEEVTLPVAPTVSKTGYTFGGWYAASDFSGKVQTVIAHGSTGNKEYWAKWNEITYTVNVSAGQHGSVSPEGEQQVGVVGIDLTATPDAHYYFNNWTVDGGAAMGGNHLTATAAGTVTANFTPSWSVRGSFNSWAEGNYIEHFEGNTGYVDIDFDADRTIEFKIYHHGDGSSPYGNTGKMTRDNCSGWTMTSNTSNCRITTDKAGTYRFSFNIDTKKLTVTYPAPDPTLSIAASAAAGTFYTGQTITFTPTTNQKGDLTLCWTCVSKPGEAAAPVFTPVAESAKVTTSLDKAGEYVFSATIGRGECGSGEYELLATAPNCTIQVADVPYVLKVWYKGVGVTGEAIPFVNGEAAVTLEAGKEYGFKLIKDRTYYTNANAADAKPTMKQTECTNWTMNHTNGAYANTLLATTIAGTYTFRLTLDGADSRRISIVYPHDAKTPANLSANAVPAANGDVMLQAYYWAHEGNTATKWQKYGSVQWADLNREAAELGDNFDLVWLAPSQATADYTGFIPTNYSIQANDWGTEDQLKTLIASLHAKNVEVIADVVLNHSNPAHPDEYTGNAPNWCSWQTQNFSEYGSFNPTWEWLAKGDEMFYAKKALMGECGTKDNTNNKEDEFGFYVNGTQYWWSEPEFNCTYARDWAHNNQNVREMSRAYLTWMRNEIGYDGFRYDFMKGFHGSHVLDYNRASGATFAVSELFEGDAAKLKGYIETTSRQSYVFDFPAKYQIMNEGIRYGLYNKLLGSNNTTLSRDDTYKKYAVTFVDNHDSFHEGSNLCGSANEMPNTGNQVLQANAYILSMPGVPCVFYPHWHEYKDAIRMMIHARKAAGINSESSITEENDGRDSYAHKMYYAKIQGTNGTVILKLGAQAQTAPSGYITAYSAANVGMYYQTTNADRVTPIVTTTTPSQEYFNQIDVNLSAMGATGAIYTIYYTTDGTTPTTSSATYTAAIPVTADNATVKAIAVKSDNAEVVSEVLTLNYTKVADKLTLDVTGTLKVGNAATLTVSKLSPVETKYTYTYQVQEPGSTGFKIVAIDGDMSHSYTLAGGGWYTFRVQTTDNGGNTFSAEERIQVENETYYLRHLFKGGDQNDGDNWANVAMQDNGDGTYMYLSDGANIFAGGDKALEETGIASKFYAANGAHVGIDPSKFNQDPQNKYTWWAATGAAGEHKKIVDARTGEKTDGNYVVWIYNAINDELKVYTPTDKIYRIQVTVGDKTYGSNIIYTAGSAEAISFYGATDASYEIQYMGAGVGEWTYLAAISKPAAITENDVYSGTVTITDQVVDEHGAVTTPATAAFSISKYTGEYQVTSLATKQQTNTMTKFNNSDTYYNHYYVEWVEGGNTYATVGNSINTNLANAIGNYTLSTGASVRYAYNPATNVFTRTHLAGSTSGERYVSAFGTNLYNTADPRAQLTSPSNGEIFSDASNWMYNVTVVAGGTDAASLDLAAQYGGAYTYLLTPSGLQDDKYMRQLRNDGAAFADSKYTVIYDYKENRILAGWNPEGALITEETNVSNVIVTRTNDGSTSEFTISAGQLIVTDKMITEFVITKAMWSGWTGSTDGDYKTMLFWISLPYDCAINSVYGFGAPYRAKSGTSWEMQVYRGDLRGAGTLTGEPWKALAPISTLSANTGYVLAVKLKASDFKTIDDKSEVRFFFPSKTGVTLTSAPQATLAANSGSTAEIQQGWNVMGVPVMKSDRGFSQSATNKFEYAYRWTWANGERWYEPLKLQDNTEGAGHEKHFDFVPGHAYMVQVKEANTLTWSYDALPGTAWAPARVAGNVLTDRDFRIDLMANDEMQDKTYVMYRSNGTRDYERGRDLEKIMNPGRSMIYSDLDQKLAAICLSDEDNTQIPLTVVVNESGEYTLQMPAPVSGVDPILYDAMESNYTLLNNGGYTVDLSAGTYEGRFYLGIRAKQPQTPTNEEYVEDEKLNAAGVQKFMQNGMLYILKDGKLYNAMGTNVK